MRQISLPQLQLLKPLNPQQVHHSVQERTLNSIQSILGNNNSYQVRGSWLSFDRKLDRISQDVELELSSDQVDSYLLSDFEDLDLVFKVDSQKTHDLLQLLQNSKPELSEIKQQIQLVEQKLEQFQEKVNSLAKKCKNLLFRISNFQIM